MTPPMLFSVSAIGAALATGIVFARARRRGLVDVPNERSSHSTPTPRGGGLGLLIGIAAGLILAASAGVAFGWEFPLALVGVVLTAFVGWRDDHGGLPVGPRLAAHIATGALILPLALLVPAPGWPFALLVAWWIFWVVSSVNVVNFIDGIDGLIALQALVFAVHCAFAASGGGTAAAALGYTLAGACAGFLLWNWAPAKIFLGDVGSGALGAFCVVLGALVAAEGRFAFTATFAPLTPIFLDAAVTLVARKRRGERLREAHRSHLYQRLANGGLGHAPVAIGYGTASVLIAVAAHRFERGGPLFTTIIVLLLLGLGWLSSALVRPDERTETGAMR